VCLSERILVQVRLRQELIKGDMRDECVGGNTPYRARSLYEKENMKKIIIMMK